MADEVTEGSRGKIKAAIGYPSSAFLMRATWPSFVKEGEASGRKLDKRTTAGRGRAYEAAIIGILPNGKPRA
jgi:hypothetical protein